MYKFFVKTNNIIMKYLKSYENINTFNIGDIVKCIDSDVTFLTKNKCYTISNITISKGKTYTYIEVEEETIPSNSKYYKERFIIPTPKEIEDYKMKHDANKYNIG